MDGVLNPRVLFVLRTILSVVWLYNGLYLKVWLLDPDHLKVVSALGDLGFLTPVRLLTFIGLGETLLGLGVLSGIAYRPLCVFQFVLIVAMNFVGIVSGGVAEPLGLVVTNLPLLGCIAVAHQAGAGRWKI